MKTGRIWKIPKTKVGKIWGSNRSIQAINRKNLDVLMGLADTRRDTTDVTMKLGK